MRLADQFVSPGVSQVVVYLFESVRSQTITVTGRSALCSDGESLPRRAHGLQGREGITERTFSKLLHGGLNSFFQVVHRQGRRRGAHEEAVRRLRKDTWRSCPRSQQVTPARSVDRARGDARKEKQKRRKFPVQARSEMDRMLNTDHATHGCVGILQGSSPRRGIKSRPRER
jgi:hypothetical protein